MVQLILTIFLCWLHCWTQTILRWLLQWLHSWSLLGISPHIVFSLAGGTTGKGAILHKKEKTNRWYRQTCFQQDRFWEKQLWLFIRCDSRALNYIWTQMTSLCTVIVSICIYKHCHSKTCVLYHMCQLMYLACPFYRYSNLQQQHGNDQKYTNMILSFIGLR